MQTLAPPRHRNVTVNNLLNFSELQLEYLQTVVCFVLCGKGTGKMHGLRPVLQSCKDYQRVKGHRIISGESCKGSLSSNHT